MSINIQAIQPTNHNTRARRRYIERQCEDAHNNVFNQYISDTPTYPTAIFRWKFRMHKHLFLRILEKITIHDDYFQQRSNATGRQGMSSLQKCTAAIRVLAYGTSPDAHDEYLRMSEIKIRESLVHFVEGIITNFGDKYVRRPSEQDLTRLLYVSEQRGFSGMMGIIDCMHWEWKNRPTAWDGQYIERSDKPTIILEAVVSYDLWIWNAFFRTSGSSNDINVLEQSLVFNDILEGRAPKINYIVNDQQTNMAYYFTDGIYPSWTAFVKPISSPQIQKHKLFSLHHEAVRKDVERAFGVLQTCFAFYQTSMSCLGSFFYGENYDGLHHHAQYDRRG